MGGPVTETSNYFINCYSRDSDYLKDNIGSFSELKVILVMLILALRLILFSGPISSFFRIILGTRSSFQRKSLALVVTQTRVWPQGETAMR